MPRRTIIIVLGFPVLAGVVIASWPRIQFWMLTGSWFPIEQIESLQALVAVKAWTTDGLLLADGRNVPLPGLNSLPSESAALTEMTSHGVEVAPDGRVYGLVRIHHWCGNDPVRKHIACLDIADVLLFLHVGQAITSRPAIDSPACEAGGSFSEWGWNVSEYFEYQMWRRMNGP